MLFQTPKPLLRLFSAVLLCATLAGCEDLTSTPNTALPPITSSGKNTFGCKVNGKVWTPLRPGANTPFGTIRDLHLDLSGGGISILTWHIVNGENDMAPRIRDETINMDFEGVKGPGKYKLGSDVKGSIAYFRDFVRWPQSSLIGYTEGTLTVTRYERKQGGVFSGLFEFTCVADDGKADTIRVTEGRFDLKF